MARDSGNEPIIVRGEGFVLREWNVADVPAMVEMFDTDEMDRWTPLAHPFDADVATEYVRQAQQARPDGTLQLAITRDGGISLGEVLLFPTDRAGVCEFAFAVGARHRGGRLAARALQALIPTAAAAGYETGRLVVATDNIASQRTAEAAGFTPAAGPLQRRERKGYVHHMATWTRTLAE